MILDLLIAGALIIGFIIAIGVMVFVKIEGEEDWYE